MNKQLLEKIYNIVNKPITFFDLETSGLSMIDDEIIQLYACKYDGTDFIEYNKNYNIKGTIKKDAFAKHGISKKDLENEIFFSEDAQNVYKTFFAPGIIICGFSSNKFDIPFIIEKMLQSSVVNAISIQNNKTIDVLTLYRELYPNTLESIYRRLMDKDMESTHNGESDTNASIEILNCLLDKFPNATLLSQYETIDTGGFFKRDGDKLVFAKGKHKGQDVVKMDREESTGYLTWISKSPTISLHSKTIALKLLDKIQ